MIVISRKPVKRNLTIKTLSKKSWILKFSKKYDSIKEMLYELKEIINTEKETLKNSKTYNLSLILPITFLQKISDTEKTIEKINIILVFNDTKQNNENQNVKKIEKNKLLDFMKDLIYGYFSKVNYSLKNIQVISRLSLTYYNLEDDLKKEEIDINYIENFIKEKMRYDSRAIIVYHIYHILYPEN